MVLAWRVLLEPAWRSRLRSAGMARVPVFEIRGYEWNAWEGMNLYIGTHGRGYYQSRSLTSSVKKVSSAYKGVNAWPVPAKDLMNLSFSANKSEKVTIEVYGLNGVRYSVQTLQTTPGSNSVKLNVQGLGAGYYFARITGTEGSNTVKFNVAR